MILPSAVVLAISGLRADPAVSALVGGRISTKLGSVLPAIRIQRIGGTVQTTYHDEPVIQVECWAEDERAADLVCRTVVDALPNLRASYPTGRIYTYDVESGPFYSPDDASISTNTRYILTVRLLTTTQ